VRATIVALASNLMNNLPTGLVAATVSQSADAPLQVTSGIIDRRRSWPQPLCDGFTRDHPVANRPEARRRSCDSVQFLKLGIFVMPPALVVALLALAAVS